MRSHLVVVSLLVSLLFQFGESLPIKSENRQTLRLADISCYYRQPLTQHNLKFTIANLVNGKHKISKNSIVTKMDQLRGCWVDCVSIFQLHQNGLHDLKNNTSRVLVASSYRCVMVTWEQYYANSVCSPQCTWLNSKVSYKEQTSWSDNVLLNKDVVKHYHDSNVTGHAFEEREKNCNLVEEQKVGECLAFLRFGYKEEDRLNE